MKVVRNLIFWLFSMLLMGAGHFAFANQENIQDVHLDEAVVTERRNPPKLEVSSSSNVIPKDVTIKVRDLPVESNNGVWCKWVKLNTNLPFLWNCIGDGNGVNQLNAFPIMIKGLMKIIISIVLVMSFLMIVAGGVMMTTAGYESGNFAKWKGMITSVAKALAMLGASWVILKLINPNFFN